MIVRDSAGTEVAPGGRELDWGTQRANPARSSPASTLLFWPRSARARARAVEELGLWDTKSETAAVDPIEMVRMLHEGRRRARELEAGRAVQELEKG